MPHQEHLPQARGELAHRSRLPGAAARLAVLIVGWLLLAGLTLAQPAVGTTTLHLAEAVRGDWHDSEPPANGWTPVRLPERWADRWPSHDGVVWYRLRWMQEDSDAAVGLLLPWARLARTVSINGMEVHRDPQLTEPLSRGGLTPRYLHLSPALLAPGENTLLVRVSGMAAYGGGLGAPVIGPPDAVRHRHQHALRLQRDLTVAGLTIGCALALVFGVFWLLRRQDSVYGWFSLMSLCWVLFACDRIATSPWPLPGTDAWEAVHTGLLLAFACCFALFMLRIDGHKWPRLEWPLLTLLAIGWADLWITERDGMALRIALWNWVAGGLVIASALLSGWPKLRRQWFPATALLLLRWVIAGVAVHDLLVFNRLLQGQLLAPLAAGPVAIGLAVLLTLRHARTGRLAEREKFSARLLTQIEAARTDLRESLEREHALRVLHARSHERTNLASDLHDGMGGMLLGTIATLEHSHAPIPPHQVIGLLKALRDDLRLIIDASDQPTSLQALGEVIGPLRRRSAELFEASDIDCNWTLENVEELTLDSSLNIGVLRFLQEALTNALKHSEARRVEVRIRRLHTQLQIEVQDDGRGFIEAEARPDGNGLRNMRKRAHRLGAQVQWRSQPGCTVFSLTVDLLSFQ